MTKHHNKDLKAFSQNNPSIFPNIHQLLKIKYALPVFTQHLPLEGRYQA